LNIFAIPGQVFEEVKGSRHLLSNWIVPTVLCGVALAILGIVVLSAPSVQEKLPELREQQIQKMNEAVAAGKATQAQADQSLKLWDIVMRPAVMNFIAAAGGLSWGIIRLFWWSLILWWMARALLRNPIPYAKAMEVAGLSSMIALLYTVVRLVLTVNIGESFGTSGLTLSVSDITAPEHRTLASWALNVVNFWIMAVLGCGLARLTGAPWFRATLLIVAYWLLSDMLFILLGAGAMAG